MQFLIGEVSIWGDGDYFLGGSERHVVLNRFRKIFTDKKGDVNTIFFNVPM